MTTKAITTRTWVKKTSLLLLLLLLLPPLSLLLPPLPLMYLHVHTRYMVVVVRDCLTAKILKSQAPSLVNSINIFFTLVYLLVGSGDRVTVIIL